MYEKFLFTLALLIALLWLIFAVEMSWGHRKTVFLKDVPPFLSRPAPKVSVIIPACNEERNIEEALQSVLHQDYPNLEIIVINDRSTDATGEILNRLAAKYPRLQIYHITELPPGWLGKNHALDFGARQATGDILLFTDADIVMSPSVISRAVNYLLTENLDHLPILMDVNMPGILLGMFTLAFGIFFAMYSRYWRAKNSGTSQHVGIGGFNMVRAEIYKNIGGHTKIAMRPDDDLKLGKLIKQAGYRQELIFGKELMHVEWYSSLWEMVRGLEKNTFAGIGYSIPVLIGASIVFFLFNTLPFLEIFFTQGMTQVINLTISAFILLFCAYCAGIHNIKRWYAIGFPLVNLIFLFIVWRSALLALSNDGINWRGTHYSLAELKANKV